MTSLTGLAVHSGLFIGRAKLIQSPSAQIPSRRISTTEVNSEIAALQESLNFLEKEFNHYLDNSALSETEKDILQTHLMILRDPEIEKELLYTIESMHFTAAAAVSSVYSKICQQFKEMDNDFFASRVGDYRDVSQRIVGRLLNISTTVEYKWDSDQIAILDEISPSQVSTMARCGLKAYCSVSGSLNSHASILSRALGLVSIVSLPKLLDIVQDDDILIVDAHRGTLIHKPDPAQLSHYAALLAAEQKKQAWLEEQTGLETVTADGRRIELYVNIELPEELDRVLKLESDGIGLFRTEFLYLDRNSLPQEEEQFDVYSKMVSALAPKPVTIRTFDLGGDKLSHLIPTKEELNPYLGSRGIRFSLSQPELFKTQLRAILRASVFGRIRIMFPMIIDAEDFKQARDLVKQIMQDLDNEGIAYDPCIELGSMIEIPSAALTADQLAQTCDFLSIGTNDLVQYTLATDRNNDAVSAYYIQHHPAIMMLIKRCIDACNTYGKALSICGEMASIPRFIPFLLGLGIRALSVNPHSYIDSKLIIRRCDQELFDSFESFDPTLSQANNEAMLKSLARYYERS